MKRITLDTIKAFIRKNTGSLYLQNISDFDPQVDGIIRSERRGFRPVKNTDQHQHNTLGIGGAWFVRGSRDRFTSYKDDDFSGFKVANCCASFILAVPLTS